MNDARTLAAVRRRRAWARHVVATQAMQRQNTRATAVFAQVGVSTAQAAEAVREFVATCQVADLWERA